MSVDVGTAMILLLLLLAAIYSGYRAIAPRPYRWSVGTVLALWGLLLMAGCGVLTATLR